MNTFIKLTSNKQQTLLRVDSQSAAISYLLDRGFFMSGGIYRHLDGSIAGIASSEKGIRVCDTQIRSTKRTWIK